MQKRDEFELNINEQITATQVRLVGENIPEQGVYPIGKALQMAEELELDLVEISGKADPPVCRILDYQKYLYQRKKKPDGRHNRHFRLPGCRPARPAPSF